MMMKFAAFSFMGPGFGNKMSTLSLVTWALHIPRTNWAKGGYTSLMTIVASAILTSITISWFSMPSINVWAAMKKWRR